MTVLIEKSMSLDEILSVNPRALTVEREYRSAVIVRTNIEELGIDILSLFPPAGRIFWSFGLFAAQDRAWRALAESLRPRALEIIDAELKYLRKKKKTINAYEFLAPFTKGMGDKYYPYGNGETPVSVWWFAQRHEYLVCASDRYPECRDYFAAQLEQIGEDCYRAADEETIMVNLGQHDGKRDYNILTMYVTRLSLSERDVARAALTDAEYLENVDPEIVDILGCRGGPEIALLHNPEDYDDAQCIRDILKARASLSVRFVTLPNLERMRISLDEEPWHWNPHDRDRSLAALDARLSQFPVIRTAVA